VAVTDSLRINSAAAERYSPRQPATCASARHVAVTDCVWYAVAATGAIRSCARPAHVPGKRVRHAEGVFHAADHAGAQHDVEGSGGGQHAITLTLLTLSILFAALGQQRAGGRLWRQAPGGWSRVADPTATLGAVSVASSGSPVTDSRRPRMQLVLAALTHWGWPDSHTPRG